jgi:hypothetical protein
VIHSYSDANENWIWTSQNDFFSNLSLKSSLPPILTAWLPELIVRWLVVLDWAQYKES